MGLKFHKRIKIAPGINLNISKKGISTSVKIGKTTLNSRGKITTNFGHGISYTTNLKTKKIHNHINENKSFEKIKPNKHTADNIVLTLEKISNTSDKITKSLDNKIIHNKNHRNIDLNSNKYLDNKFYKLKNSKYSWANLSDKQVKYYNIFIKLLFLFSAIISAIASFISLLFIPLLIVTGIIAFKFDAHKLRETQRNLITNYISLKDDL